MNDLEELGGTRLLLMNQYNTGIFSCLFYFVILRSPWDVKNINMKIILPEKLSGVTLDLNGNSWTSWQSCNVLNPGKYSTRSPLAHHQFCRKICILVSFWTMSICLPMQCLIGCSRVSYPDTIQNLKIRKPLCARDWWLLHHWPKIMVSMKNLPSLLSSLHISRMIVRIPIFQTCRTSVSLWDLLNSWWKFKLSE